MDDVLVVKCQWLGFVSRTERDWKISDRTEFRLVLGDFTAQNSAGQLLLVHKEGPEKGMAVFFPKGQNLDPAKVKGLVL